MSEAADQPVMPFNDLGYELPFGVLDTEDAVAVSDFVESMLEKS